MSNLGDPIYVPLWLAIVAGAPQVLNILLHFVLQYRMNKLQHDLSKTGREINGRMTQLLDVTAKAEFAKGELSEKGKLT